MRPEIEGDGDLVGDSNESGHDRDKCADVIGRDDEIITNSLIDGMLGGDCWMALKGN